MAAVLDTRTGSGPALRARSRKGFGRARVPRFRDGVRCYFGDGLAGTLLRPTVKLRRSGGALDLVELRQDRLHMIIGERIETRAPRRSGVRKVPPFAAHRFDRGRPGLGFLRLGDVADSDARPFTRTCARSETSFVSGETMRWIEAIAPRCAACSGSNSPHAVCTKQRIQ